MSNHIRVPQVLGDSSQAMDKWFEALYVEGFLFNPDDSPEDIVQLSNGEPTFTENECRVLRESLDRLFSHHGETVYDTALKYFYRAVGITPEHANA